MIKINLISEKRKRIPGGPKKLILSLVAVNLSALLIVGVTTLWLKGAIAKLNDQGEANKSVVASLTSKIDAIKNLEKLNKALEGRTTLIETLRKSQSIPVLVLDEVSKLIPEGVWLVSLVFKDNGISLEGYAFSNIDVVSFIDKMKKSTVLTDTYLEESRESGEQFSQKSQTPEAKEGEKIKIYKFKLNSRVKV